MMEPQTQQNSQEQSDSATPLDGVIAQVESYIKNPKLVTPETLSSLKDELESIKNDIEGEESDEGESQGTEPKAGLIIHIGKAMRGAK